MKLLDLFSGIGGFHKGFEQAGWSFDWVGFSDIDKYASAVYKYRYKGAIELGDIKLIQPKRDLPDHIDILSGGFPCQAFSVAGKRLGFEDTRGTLFFEIVRILRHYLDTGKPINYFVLENVKGLLSHDNGRTFAVIYGVLADLGYTIECQLINTRWLLPQNRERIYIVGHIGRGSRHQVFPIGESIPIPYNRTTEVASTLQHHEHSGGNYKGMNMINTGLKQIGVIGKDATATRVYNPSGIARTLTDGGGMGAKTGLYQVKAVLTPDRKEKRQNGRRMKEDGEPQTLDTGMQQYTIDKTAIRRLTPVECMRLQGFPDDWNEKGMIDGKEVNMSDTQRYKQAGNAVTVNVVELIASKIRGTHNGK